MKKAVGIRYRKGEGLPGVVVKGSGYVVDGLLETAKENNVPTLENKELVEKLYKIPVDHEIGSDLFKVVASILVYIYSLDDEYKER